MTDYGRNPGSCAILTAIQPIISETESIAREKQAFINEFVDVDLGLFVAGYSIGADLTQFPLDEPLSMLAQDSGSRGIFDAIVQATKSDNLSLRDLAKSYVTSHVAPQIVGTPESVADQLQDYFTSGCCDGFIVTPTEMPGTFEAFSRSVVPLLQQRGIFRKDYDGQSLRSHLSGTTA